MRPIILGLSLLFSLSGYGQFLAVKDGRSAILKKAPSGDAEIYNDRLAEGTVVKQLNSAPRYYSVQTPAGLIAWSYKGNFREATDDEASSFSVSEDDIDPNPNSLLARSDLFKVSFIDVEVGDATLIICPEEGGVQDVILIDTGENDQYRIKDELRFYGFSTAGKPITRIYITHHHHDHMGDAVELLSINQVIYDHGDQNIKQYYLNAVSLPGIDRRIMKLSYQETFSGGVSIKCVATNNATQNHPNRQPSYSENANSIALIISWEDFDLFVGGDLTEEGEKSLSTNIKNVDVYQVNHHGSVSTSSEEDFVIALDPEVSIASNGTSHGHPSKGVALRLINKVKSKFYQTNNNQGDSRAHNPDPKFVADDTYHGGNIYRENAEGAKGTIRIVVDPVAGKYYVIMPGLPLDEATFDIEK